MANRFTDNIKLTNSYIIKCVKNLKISGIISPKEMCPVFPYDPPYMGY